MFDLVVKNGKVVDGSGAGEVVADIGIIDDKIADIGDLNDAEAKSTIHADSLLICPGFIDVHSHSDESYLVNPLAESKLLQGITTEIVGNCGYSPFPISDFNRQRYQDDMREWGIEIDWSNATEFLERVAIAKPALNIVPQIGQGSLRAAVMGYESRPPSPDEMKSMKGKIAESMDAGCWGISTGLIYPPGCFSNLEELIELTREVQQRGGFYTSHIRSEGDNLIESIDEAINIGRGTGALIEIAHLKAAGVRNWGKSAQAIEMIMQARQKEGIRVGFDRYPYTASATGLSSLLPEWAHAGGREQTIEYIRDPETSDRMIDEMRRELEASNGWGSVILSYAGTPDYEQFEGLSIKEIATVKNLSPEILVFYILLKSKFTAGIYSFTMNGNETDAILAHPQCAVCTDATARAFKGHLSKGKPHPRAFGTFPKFFRNYVKEKKTLSVGEAVARTTSMPAERFGIKQRGLIKKGYFADILIIDWDNFSDTASYERPVSRPEGIPAILVNGKTVYMDGEYTGEQPGRILYKE